LLYGGQVLNVTLTVHPDPESDPAAEERLLRALRAELLDLDVESVEFQKGAAPEGAKSSDVVTLGAMIVALSASGGVLTTLVEVLRDWLGRRAGRYKISVTIDGDPLELERATAEQQQAIVLAYIERHSRAREG
jgi:hypothetical protein